jgi:hypothetical protein
VHLQRVVVEVLRPIREVGAGDPRRRTRPGEVVPDPDLALLRAEAAGDPVELRVTADPGAVRGEVPRLAGEVLDGDVLELRAVTDEEL